MNASTESTKMERKLFETQIAALSLNYRQKVDMKTVDLYWDHFKDSNRDDFTAALLALLDKEEYFPNIATIKKYFPKQYGDFKKGWPDFDDVKKSNKSPMARDCLKMFYMMFRGELNRDEGYKAMLDLENKYPGVRPLTFRRAADLYLNGKRYEGE